ncbi:hypothetical protein D3C81_2229570 [compost metagenome]
MAVKVYVTKWSTWRERLTLFTPPWSSPSALRSHCWGVIALWLRMFSLMRLTSRLTSSVRLARR